MTMAERGLREELASWASHMEKLQWPAVILDEDWRLSWVSDELLEFIGAEAGDESLGYGKHVAEVFVQEKWMRTIHPDSQMDLFLEFAPFAMKDLRERGHDPRSVIPEQFIQLLDAVEPADVPNVWASSFLYRSPNKDDNDLPDYRVNVSFIRLKDDEGSTLGWLAIFFMGVRPNLLTLLGRGDEQMYERMAKLVNPGPREAAILFCDLQGSFELSRRLPSASYFQLVRRLWTGIDGVVADETGIIGKHAGDGASAYFLVDDVGSRSAAAAAAFRAARRIHEVSDGVFSEILEDPCVMKVGIHWGGNLFMGQLVPGGRLDVTALGDEVNQAARVQESAGPGKTLASKELYERLAADEADRLGLDLADVRFQTVAQLDTASDKAKADAGSIAVAAFS